MSEYGLIDRYIAEVGRELPRKSRLDIEAEILTALEEMLAERCRKTGKPADEEMIVSVLKEYGAPRKVAASYQPERYLVGPNLFSSFLTVIRVVLPVVAAIALVKIGISLGQTVHTFETAFETIFLGIADFLSTSFAALGAILVLFAIVQRFLPQFKERTGDWDPRSLPRVTSRSRVDTGGMILEIFGAGLAIVLFNFFPQLVSIGYHANGQWWVGLIAVETGIVWNTTLLSDAFFRVLPALTSLWAFIILLDATLLSRGRWETWSRWVAFILNIATISLACIMITGPALLNVSAETLITAGFPDVFAAKVVANFLNQGTILVLGIAIIANINMAIRLLIRLTGTNLTPRLEKFAHP
jgi:hypothetical protein